MNESNEEYMTLYEKMSRLHWLMQRHNMSTHAAHGPHMDPARGQGRVLAMLRIQSEISTKDLSYLLGIRQQSLNELLGKLEKAEYVTRTPSETDRRVMIVRLTEKGAQAQTAERDYGDIFGCLSHEEQETLRGYLDRVIAALEEQLGIDTDETQADWMRSFRERYGEEGYARMMSMRGGHRPRGPEGYRGPWHEGPGPHDRPRGPHGRGPREPHHPYDAGFREEGRRGWGPPPCEPMPDEPVPPPFGAPEEM